MKSTGIFSLILLLEQGSGQVTDDKTFSVSRDITIMRLLTMTTITRVTWCLTWRGPGACWSAQWLQGWRSTPSGSLLQQHQVTNCKSRDIFIVTMRYYLDSASCVAEAATATLQSGWPLTSDTAASPASICWRKGLHANKV